VLQCVAVRFVRMVKELMCPSVCVRAKCARVNVSTSGSFYMCACVCLSVYVAGRSGGYGAGMVQLDRMCRRVKIHHVLQRVAVCCSMLQCVVACCSVLQRVVVCCSV